MHSPAVAAAYSFGMRLALTLVLSLTAAWPANAARPDSPLIRKLVADLEHDARAANCVGRMRWPRGCGR
jgi:hypothetical protein